MKARPFDRLPVLAIASVLAALAPLASANVWVVASQGGGDFTQIQPAINASADGDTLIVKPGGYSAFTIVDKSIWILAEMPGSVAVNGNNAVRDLAAGKSVVLSGLSCTGAAPLELTNDVGHVRAQDCSFSGGLGARITSCLSVAFQACLFVGGNAFNNCSSGCGNGGDGVWTTLSIVAFYDCTLVGGDGASTDWASVAGSGGHGCNVDTFGVFASGTNFFGGNGGSATGAQGQIAGHGGYGVFVNHSTQAQLLDNLYFPGTGGIAREGWDGSPGQNAGGLGNAHLLNGTKRLCSAQPLVGSGQSLLVTFVGQPGDRVYLPMSAQSNWSYAPLLAGVWLLPLPVWMNKVPIAVIPASGTTTVQVPMPVLPPSESLRRVFAQALFRSAQGTAVLGSGLTIAVRN
ncbi:MAG: hypothetical protein ACKVWV_00955 [Planctomycetota bacterium]